MTLAEFFAEILARGFDLRVRVTGRSMSPALVDGDIVTLRRADSDRLRRGDLVLYRGRAGRSLVLHRIVAEAPRGEGRLLRTRGDALARDDEPVAAAMVLGRVILVERRTRGPAAALRRFLARALPFALRRSLAKAASSSLASVAGPGRKGDHDG